MDTKKELEMIDKISKKNKDLFDLRNIFIEHDADGDYLSVSKNGKVVFDGTAKEVFEWLESEEE